MFDFGKLEPLKKASIALEKGGSKTLQKVLPPERYWWLSKKYYIQTRKYDIHDYDPTVDPFKIFWVDPNMITRYTHRSYPPWQNRFNLFGKVKDGDWDISNPDRHKYPKYIDQETGYKSLKLHFIEDVPWEETKFIQEQIKQVKQGKTVWHGCTSRSDILKRGSYLDNLYHDIITEGYKTQKELLLQKEEKTFRSAVCDEVAVDIARDGEFLFVDGSHRLVMSQLLDLDKIPVVVLVRHAKWMNSNPQSEG